MVEHNNRPDSATMNDFSTFDVVCITDVDNSNISSLNPDLVVIKTDEIKHLKTTFMNTLKQEEIYI